MHQRLHLRSNFFDNIHSLLRPGHHLKPSVRHLSIMMPLHSVPSTLQIVKIFHTDIPQWVKPRRKHRRRRHSLQVLQTLHTQRDIPERRRHPPGQIMVRKRGKIPLHPRYNPRVVLRSRPECRKMGILGSGWQQHPRRYVHSSPRPVRRRGDGGRHVHTRRVGPSADEIGIDASRVPRRRRGVRSMMAGCSSSRVGLGSGIRGRGGNSMA